MDRDEAAKEDEVLRLSSRDPCFGMTGHAHREIPTGNGAFSRFQRGGHMLCRGARIAQDGMLFAQGQLGGSREPSCVVFPSLNSPSERKQVLYIAYNWAMIR